MSITPTITVPIATGKNTSCVLTLPWFVQSTEYPPVPATFEPLVNGECAFGAVYDAIEKANNSVEIICWGFQPSMYFKRGDTSSLCIGQLLGIKAAERVKVRILCWSDSLHLTAVFSENMTPGRNVASFMTDERNEAQRDFDWEWYRRATKTDVKQRSWFESNTPLGAMTRARGDLLSKAFSFGKEAFENIEFVARDLSLTDRIEIAWQVAWKSADSSRSTFNKAATTGAMSMIPTHHQKMVLVDYETPDTAVGFVMGHNTLDAYWDKDDHGAHRMHAQFGRNGKTPRQDISSRVTGPVLEYLNHNFAQAWLHETGVDLLTKRRAHAKALTPRPGFGPPMMAQVLRTQIQEGRQDIKTLYLQAARNVTSFLYLENQYFRWQPLAEEITKAARVQVEKGRDTSLHGPIYLFVVTNSTKEGMGDGTVNTYRMLKQLGRPDIIPNVARLERRDELNAEVAQAKQKLLDAHRESEIFNRAYGKEHGEWVSRAYEPTANRLKAAQKAYDDVMEKLPAEDEKPVVPEDIPGLKVLVCTLVAPDSPPKKWVDVYIHSKLMIIDDVFTTLGSTNINTRSMEVDSELNICVEDPAVARPLRKQLWKIHAGEEGAGDDIRTAFNTWTRIADNNAAHRANTQNSEPPLASITEFRRESASRTYLD